MNWWPDRKWFAGGIAGLVTLAITAAVRQFFGWDLPADIQSALATGASALLFWAVPPSKYDIVRRINNGLVKLATADPLNPTTAIIVPVAVSESPRATALAVSAGVEAAAAGPAGQKRPLPVTPPVSRRKTKQEED